MTNNEIVIHGTFLNIFGIGTLIIGKPGVGKSQLALGLIDRKHQFIADDAPVFSLANNKVFGKNPLSRHFIFIRNIGTIDITALFGPTSVMNSSELQMLIKLQTSCSNEAFQPEGNNITKDIFRYLIPCVTIPIIKPRHLEVLVETIVKNHLLKINKEWLPVASFEELLRRKMGQSCS